MQSIPANTVIDGRYIVHERIGSGGMADVYRATDRQLGREVALKLMYRRFAEDDEFVERFRREASSAAGLQHPNVVAVFDRGEWDETYYISMEFLRGRTLKTIVREEGPLEPSRAIDIVVQVLRAARFAHRRGIIHRDFKPHNVIVDDDGRAKVTDFGIARAGASDMTETGSIMGTAQYLSPEQAQGHAVSAASDLYSIGILLYECLTGRVPFDAESAVTIALKQVSEDPIPPRSLNPAVSPALERAVLQALQKDPSDRFEDADEFIEALEVARDLPPGTGAEDVPQPGRLTGAYPGGALGDGWGEPGSQPLEPARLAYEVDPNPSAVVDGAPRRSPARWVVGALLLALVLALVAFGLYRATRPAELAVPNVVGRDLATAVTALREMGFRVESQRVRSDSPSDEVINQDPPAGDVAAEGDAIELLVSDGPGNSIVPATVGLTERSARARVQAAGFDPAIRRAASSTVPEGRVISSSPDESSQLERNSRVTLTVSSGPAQVVVPTLRGLDEDEAESRLRALGLESTVVRRASEEEAGTVLGQSVVAGTRVDEGATVRLTVARQSERVRVPDLSGMTFNDALDALDDSGLSGRRREREVTSSELVERVLAQNPAAGSPRKRDSVIYVTVGVLREEDEPAPPDSTQPLPTATPEPTVTAVPPATTREPLP